MIGGLILATVQAGRLDLSLADYGVSFLFFGALAAWARWAHALSLEERIARSAALLRRIGSEARDARWPSV